MVDAINNVDISVKHLNPRQGITTWLAECYSDEGVERVCETPKSPPGDYNRSICTARLHGDCVGVKHLNPRQGITTTPLYPPCCYACSGYYGVKHLNPRQGITTNTMLSWIQNRTV